jgi:hypothetical protein
MIYKFIIYCYYFLVKYYSVKELLLEYFYHYEKRLFGEYLVM